MMGAGGVKVLVEGTRGELEQLHPILFGRRDDHWRRDPRTCHPPR